MDPIPQQLIQQLHRALETLSDLAGEVDSPRGLELLEDANDRLLAALELVDRLDADSARAP